MIVYYAPGSIGFGHATRAATIAQHLEDCHVVTEPQGNDALDVLGISYSTACAEDLLSEAMILSPSAIIWDAEAPAVDQRLPIPTVFIHRLGRDGDDYDLTVDPIDSFPSFFPIHRHEFLPRDVVRTIIEATICEPIGDRHVVGYLHSSRGGHGPFERAAEITGDPSSTLLYALPSGAQMRGCDEIISAAGANAVAELHSSGIPHTIVPVEADQLLRAELDYSSYPRHDRSEELAAFILGLLHDRMGT